MSSKVYYELQKRFEKSERCERCSAEFISNIVVSDYIYKKRIFNERIQIRQEHV